jgi:hypothetical protein
MDFYWVGLIFWTLIVASFLLLILGLWNKSWRVLIYSGISLILPSLYFVGGENWVKLLVLFPLIPFVLALYIKKSVYHFYESNWLLINGPLLEKGRRFVLFK